jgi:hypothetical protein
MPVPWLRILDSVINATDIVRWARGQPVQALEHTGSSQGLEARLAGVVVSALKEAFDRDHERLQIERERIEDQRERAERAMRLEHLRQVGEREIGRMRVLAGTALVSWLSTLLLFPRVADGGTPGRLAFGLGWAFLVGAMGAGLWAEQRVSHAMARMDDRSPVTEVTASGIGVAAPLLIVIAWTAIALGALLS